MATILAANNGNWSASGTWTSGIIPTSGDSVYANGRSVTIDVNINVLEIRNDTFSGSFNTNTTRVIRANIICGTVSSIPACLYVNAPCTIIGNITAGGAGGLLTTPFGCAGLVINSNVIVTISGNIIGGSNSNCVGLNIPFGTGVVTGNITGGTHATAYGVYIPSNGGVLIVDSGTIQGSSVTNAVNYNSPSGNISANIIGPTAGSVNSIVYNNSVGTLIINGSVIGPAGGTASTINNTSTGQIIVNGIVTGGTTSAGVINTSAGTVTVNGTAIGGSGNVGVYNNSIGSVYCTLAKGNAYGIGSSGLTPQVGLFNLVAGNCYVSGLEFGDRGMSPVIGPVQFLSSTGNYCSMHRPSDLSKKILVDPLVSGSLLPLTSDVRKNTIYGFGNLAGSVAIPPSESVSYGVLTDNTSGTAILTNPNQIWDYPVSSITGVNSIGNRLKNCSTVENLGQQLANILSSMSS